jgi:hypothetical protein
MTDPPRLLDVESDELTRSLLEYGAREAPSAGVRRRIHAAATAATAIAAVAPLAAAPIAAKSLAAGIVAWAGVGLVAGAVTSGAALLVSQQASEPHRVAAVEHEASAAPVAAERSEPAPRSLVVESAAEAQKSSVGPPRGAVTKGLSLPRATAARTVPAPAQPAFARDSLQQELALLDRARRALQRGDAPEAMAALDAHGERGVLTPEARVLRIEALVLRGDRAGARRLADTFLAEDARSPHANRVRALLLRAQ